MHPSGHIPEGPSLGEAFSICSIHLLPPYPPQDPDLLNEQVAWMSSALRKDPGKMEGWEGAWATSLGGRGEAEERKPAGGGKEEVERPEEEGGDLRERK